MNFTSIIFILAAIVCLVAANSDSSLETNYHIEANNLEINYEYKSSDIAEGKLSFDWATIYYLIREAVSKLKGVQCTVKEVENIKTATETFLEEIKACGDVKSLKVHELIELSEEIVWISNDIIDVKENICNKTETTTAAPTESVDNLTRFLDIKTPFVCFFKLLTKTIKLQDQLNYAIFLTDAVSNTPNESNVCTVNAATTLGNILKLFPEYLKYCSQLLP